MFPLRANVRGQGALYPPRGVPRGADGQVQRGYSMPVLVLQLHLYCRVV